jgi:hypothetical protein
MTGCNHGIGLATALLALALAVPVGAQENLDSGKTGAQLFAANCALCHKSPQALSKSGGLFGLSGFLREHYTSSRETATVIATYLESLGPAPGKRGGATKREEKAKTSGPKTSEPKIEPKIEPKRESKTAEPKSGEGKPAEPKAKDAKSSAPKPPAKPDKPEKSD